MRLSPLHWGKARWWAMLAQVMVWMAAGLAIQPNWLGWLLLASLATVSNLYGRTAERDDLDKAVYDELHEARERRRRTA